MPKVEDSKISILSLFIPSPKLLKIFPTGLTAKGEILIVGIGSGTSGTDQVAYFLINSLRGRYFGAALPC